MIYSNLISFLIANLIKYNIPKMRHLLFTSINYNIGNKNLRFSNIYRQLHLPRYGLVFILVIAYATSKLELIHIDIISSWQLDSIYSIIINL